MKPVWLERPGGAARWSALILLVVLVAAVFCSGCGIPSSPGQHFNSPRVSSDITPTSPSPIPNPPFFEGGPQTAKVRVIAYYPMDEQKDHKLLMDQMKAFVKQYPGKVYVKYIDIRSEQGQSERKASGGESQGLLINGASSVMIQAKPQAHPVNFDLDLGRYWTLDNLKDAVAQAVAKAYPK